ncbi:hypothetical protein PROFUN_12000 [Planoprotostelium fungivorum]|uniref:Uncharacterized protein n=1 Tax=Planoprotostelium fungivorum TaxID=1890364 RepID=A0A2P6MRC5_9EUKA|nr:hypothetical protein PROFUN_12000 [Planoprotostelium fungivorum]
MTIIYFYILLLLLSLVRIVRTLVLCCLDNTGRSPFRRLLSWHAECTYTTALKKTWIDQPAFDTFTTYDNLSNGARPDFLEDLDNEE